MLAIFGLAHHEYGNESDYLYWIVFHQTEDFQFLVTHPPFCVTWHVESPFYGLSFEQTLPFYVPKIIAQRTHLTLLNFYLSSDFYGLKFFTQYAIAQEKF